MKKIMSDILVIGVMVYSIWIFVEMILVLLRKIPPQHVAYTKETALSVKMVWHGIVFLLIALLFFLFDV